MDSRRHFLRGLARAAGNAASAAASGAEVAADPPAAPPASAELDPAQRYAGAAWGSEGQAALFAAEVLVIGAGALATPVLGYLAAAGVGRLGVLDDADVALPDLTTETIHFTPDVGVPKARSAAVKLGFLNSDVVIEPYQVRLEAANADGLLEGQDLIVDCSNDEETRDAVADGCARLGIPLVTAGMQAGGGWLISVPAGEHACPDCAGLSSAASSAVSGPAAGMLGSLQAHEAIARLLDPSPAGCAVRLSLASPALQRTALTHRADCPRCAER